MSAFTDFIQLELPKRPYLENDVQQNSVIIRSGAGPRQLEGVKLLPGQILMNVSGTLQAVTLADVTGDTDNHVHVQDSNSATWNIAHGGSTENVIVQLYDDTGKQFMADEITIVDADNITVDLSQPSIGKAIVIFF